MRTAKAAAAALLAAGFAAVPAAAASADPLPAPEVAWVGQNVIVTGADADSAAVLAKYRCYGGEEGTHLWVSVKQGGADLEGEGSSQRATSWYDTNYHYAQDPAGLTVDCDGHWHTTRFVLKRVAGKAPLVDGPAWVQFCLFDSSSTEDNFPTGFASDSSWKTVRTP
ncbi:hypothetical protein GCM10017786_04440 [Amycolatopsis deserti]|uniref:Secreted protein n=1 Tax=Amycolatopsis deserti TaxID=185696 RepID=A0ABQ3IF15_9PSEU|nr:hypothetical protein [Amycolatopsis deserti]GHE77990.1 hypothetical protein GCM10017786_04440 [Amycolatopsis deserti]